MNKGNQWEQEWELYQSLRSAEANHPDLEDLAGASDGKTAGEALAHTVSVSPMQEKGALDKLRSAVKLPASASGSSQQDPADPSFHTASHSMLANVLGNQAKPATIKPGEIRHLLPELVPDAERPVFALVIEVKDNKALLMSFGPLSHPATTDELATGMEDHGLQVLSLWNAAWVPVDTVSKSWIIEVQADELLKDVKSLKASVHAGTGIPRSLLDRVGASVEHPQDPRWDYLESEGELFLGMLGD